MHSAELEAELDSVREEANSRISQLEGTHQDQARLAQHHTSELTTRRKEIEDLQAKLHSRSGVLADHSERAKQLQQVCFCHDMLVLCYNFQFIPYSPGCGASCDSSHICFV